MLIPIPRDTTTAAPATLARMSQERWTGDYRSIGLIDWPHDLRAQIEATKSKASRQILGLAAMALGLIVSVVLVGLGSASTPTFNWLVVTGIILSILILLAAVLVMCFSGRQTFESRWRAARRALRNDFVERFEKPHDRDRSDSGVEYLIAAPDGSLEVASSDSTEPTLERLRIVEIATAPETTDEHIHERELSPSEFQELCDHANRVRDRAWQSVRQLVVGFLVISGSVLMLYLAGQMSWPAGLTAAGVSGLWLATLCNVIRDAPRRLRIARCFDLDLDACVLETVDGSEAFDGLDESPLLSQADSKPIPGSVHRLSQSKAWWVVDGIPAEWRRYQDY